MRTFLLALMLLAGSLLPPAVAVSAADRVPAFAQPPVVGPHPPIWRFNGPPQEPPFTPSPRAQAVWEKGACWSECGAYCAWAMDGCIRRDTQGICLAYTDACDRYCQRSCRGWASGPFLPID